MEITLNSSKVQKKREYIMFSENTLLELRSIFKKNKYPNFQEIESLAAKFSENPKRIRNWFRAQRRRQFNEGMLKHERKYVFSESDNLQLEQIFKESKYPSCQLYKKIAINLKCQTKNIKNWFSYKRKKERNNEKILKNEIDENKPLNIQEHTHENTSMSDSFKNFSPLFFNYQINPLIFKPQNIITYIPVQIINVPMDYSIIPGLMTWNL